MAVICAKCGEELLGAVNRCWRCGQRAVSSPDAAAAPPVRRSPVSLPQDDPDAESAANVPAQSDAAPSAVGDLPDLVISDEETRIEQGVESAATAAPTPAPAGDSTDSDNSNNGAPPQSSPAVTSPRTATTARQAPWRDWLAIAGVVLGLLAMGLGWLTPWMLPVAAAGIVLGVLGIASRRKGLAIFALLLCLLGVSISSVRLAYNLFLYLGDQVITPVEPLPEDELFEPLDAIVPE